MESKLDCDDIWVGNDDFCRLYMFESSKESSISNHCHMINVGPRVTSEKRQIIGGVWDPH